MNEQPQMKLMEFGQPLADLQKDLMQTLSRHTNLPDQAVLACVCQIVGMMIAHCDTEKTPPDQVMQVVMKNIQQGNEKAMLAHQAQQIHKGMGSVQ